MKQKVELNPEMGRRLKKCIEDKGMTQKKFAEMAGYSEQYISYIVSEKRNMSLTSAREFAKILDVDAEYLLCETEYRTFREEIDKESEDDKKKMLMLHEGALSLLKANGISIEFFTRKYHNKEHDVSATEDDICEEYDDEANEMLKEKVAQQERMDGWIVVYTEEGFARVQFEDEPSQVFEYEEIDRFVQDIIDFAEFQAVRIKNKLKYKEEQKDFTESIVRDHFDLGPSED